MAKKRRTKKQKTNAKHDFGSWQNLVQKESHLQPVKGQKKPSVISASRKQSDHEKADSLVNNTHLGQIKKDVLKSLVLFSLILGTEVVLYFIWA